MSCITATLDRCDGFVSSLSRTDRGITTHVSVVSQMLASLGRTDTIRATALRKDSGVCAFVKKLGGIVCRATYTCEVNFRKPYLEIEPTFLWVYSDFETMNDVYSNVTWKID